MGDIKSSIRDSLLVGIDKETMMDGGVYSDEFVSLYSVRSLVLTWAPTFSFRISLAGRLRRKL